MLRSALIVEAPPSPVLASLRSKFARDARAGVPPHLTVLFPFVPTTDIDDATLAPLSKTLQGVPAFEFKLTALGWFDDRILWLGPHDPAPFIALTAAVSHAFPDLHPAHVAVIPHVTVGDSAAYLDLHHAEKLLAAELPLTGTASAITLLVEREDGHWIPRARFPLGPAL